MFNVKDGEIFTFSTYKKLKDKTNMKKSFLAGIILVVASIAFSAWKPAGNKIKTKWATQINPASVLPEYPRPQMERQQWLNLNGLWNYAIVAKDSVKPQKFDGEILVPFAVESSLSGVQKALTKDQELWYERSVTIPELWKGKNILINFGAVDWKAEVFVNGNHVGTHTGGYAPFSFDITNFLQAGENKISVKVWDPTDSSLLNPTGKQTMKPSGCHYTAVSGIWQTVWLEPVEPIHIKQLKVTPNLDCSRFEVEAKSDCKDTVLEVKIFDAGKVVAQSKSNTDKKVFVEVQNPKLWTPETPNLYNIEVSLIKDGKILDTVKSYSAMRKFSIIQEGGTRGIKWMTLNNQKIYMFGPLDQGWWPDGLYTAPTEEALVFDIIKTKDMGFNMIRKHIKVEPARWYYNCDKLGMIVWQDIPSCHRKYTTPWVVSNFVEDDAKILENDTISAEMPHAPVREFQVVKRRDVENFHKEMTEIVEALYSFPCISVWVPFNENWGQFDTINTVNIMRKLDSTRIINAASGGNYFQCGDMIDIHSYPAPRILILSRNYVNTMGEYGGLPVTTSREHLWNPEAKNWGYTAFNSPEEIIKTYEKYANILKDMISHGIVGAVYTQTTDVEIEINGLMTYDRKVVKMNEKKLREINQSLINHINKK